MGDKESRKPLTRAVKATLAALSSPNSVDATEEEFNAHSLVLEEVQALLSARDREGYIRIGWGRDGVPWARFKWTGGHLAGKYTFGSGDSVGMALEQVCERVYACESGKRHAHTDEGYRPRRTIK